jgi:uncharacterized protein (DUF488 family)
VNLAGFYNWRLAETFPTGTMKATQRPQVLTIGHSNHSIETFLQLLAEHHIDVLIDPRSSPYSKYSPQFNHDNLKLAVANAGRKYYFLGRELGGKPKDSSFYDASGHVLYWKIAESPQFEEAIQKVLRGIASYKVALMCGEEDPSNCHRRLLIARVLLDRGVEVLHIRGDSSIQTETELDEANGTAQQQMTLFPETNEDERWKSIQSVSRKKPPLSSSKS